MPCMAISSMSRKTIKTEGFPLKRAYLQIEGILEYNVIKAVKGFQSRDLLQPITVIISPSLIRR
jgi:hypothetical protein